MDVRFGNIIFMRNTKKVVIKNYGRQNQNAKCRFAIWQKWYSRFYILIGLTIIGFYERQKKTTESKWNGQTKNTKKIKIQRDHNVWQRKWTKNSDNHLTNNKWISVLWLIRKQQKKTIRSCTSMETMINVMR